MANEVKVQVTADTTQATKAIATFTRNVVTGAMEMDKASRDAQAKTAKAAKASQARLKFLANESQSLRGKFVSSFQGMNVAMGVFAGNILSGAVFSAFNALRNAPTEAFRAFQEFESGLIEVSKTTNISGKNLEKLGKGIESLSSKIPVTTKELLGIAKAAGQLGVTGNRNILNFTETIAKLGQVSNIDGDAAATSLTRILNITKTSVDNIDELASVIVDLGNNFAASESEIVSMTNEIARGTAVFNVSAQDAAALGTVIKATGGRAEEAGGVMTKSFGAIQKAINGGGESLKQLSKLTGIAGKDLRGAFRDNSLGVFRQLLDGVAKSGDRASLELEKMGLSGLRVSKVIPTLARNTDQLDDALSRANQEMTNATALNEELEKSLVSSKSQTQLMTNELGLLIKSFGEDLAPAVNSAAGVLKDFFAFLRAPDAKKNVEELTAEIENLQGALDTEIKSDTTGGLLVSPNVTGLQIRIDKLKELRNELDITNIAADENRKFSGGVGLGEQPEKPKEPEVDGGLTKEDQKRINSKIAADAEVAALDAERELIVDEREIVITERKQNEWEKDLERTHEIELEKINIKANAEQAKIDLVEDKNERENKSNVLQAKTELQLSKASAKQDKEIQDKKAKRAKASRQANFNSAQNFARAGAMLAKEGSAAFKLLSITDASIATYVGATKAYRDVPYPANIAASASIVALGLANVAKISGFEHGGVVGGFSGATSGPDNRLATVRTGEMILNSGQQKTLFDRISNDALGETQGEDSLSLAGAISELANTPIIVQIDGKEIARATRDAVRDGFQVAV